jgi:hypothetical protein
LPNPITAIEIFRISAPECDRTNHFGGPVSRSIFGMVGSRG